MYTVSKFTRHTIKSISENIYLQQQKDQFEVTNKSSILNISFGTNKQIIFLINEQRIQGICLLISIIKRIAKKKLVSNGISAYLILTSPMNYINQFHTKICIKIIIRIIYYKQLICIQFHIFYILEGFKYPVYLNAW